MTERRRHEFVKGRDAIDVELWEENAAMFSRQGVSIDTSKCPTRRDPTGYCLCKEKCRICDFGIHASLHGPTTRDPVGGRPFGHEFILRTEDAKRILRNLGRD